MTASSGDIRRDFPLRHGIEAVKVGSTGRAAGAGWNKKVADGREHVDEPLQPSGRSKTLPRPFSPAERQMRILRTVIQPLVRPVLDFWHDLTVGGSVGAELVGDHSPGWAALLLQQPLQQALRRLGVAATLDDFIEHIAVLINRPPEPMFLARDRDHDLVEMPNIAAVWSRHRQFNELKAKRHPGSPDQKLMATPVTSAQAVKAWERASRCSAALLLAELRKKFAT